VFSRAGDGDSELESSLRFDKSKQERSDTPSTEDDKASDAEQQSTRSGTRRGASRSGRDYSDSVPSSPASTQAVTDEEKDYRAWKKSIMLVYGRIAAHKSASLFLRPITDDKAPGYSQMIYRYDTHFSQPFISPVPKCFAMVQRTVLSSLSIEVRADHCRLGIP